MFLYLVILLLSAVTPVAAIDGSALIALVVLGAVAVAAALLATLILCCRFCRCCQPLHCCDCCGRREQERDTLTPTTYGYTESDYSRRSRTPRVWEGRHERYAYAGGYQRREPERKDKPLVIIRDLGYPSQPQQAPVHEPRQQLTTKNLKPGQLVVMDNPVYPSGPDFPPQREPYVHVESLEALKNKPWYKQVHEAIMHQ